MLAVALLLTATALCALLVIARRTRDAAQEAIMAIAGARRELRPALLLARDDTQRAARIRLPERR